MSQTIISAIAILLANLLPQLGVEVGSDSLTTTITTIVTVVGAIYIWVRRVKVGDVKPMGARK